MVPGLYALPVRNHDIVDNNNGVFARQPHAVDAITQRNIVKMSAVNEHQIKWCVIAMFVCVSCDGFHAVTFNQRVSARKLRVNKCLGVVHVIVIPQIEADNFGVRGRRD